jgi:hypothetical protein
MKTGENMKEINKYLEKNFPDNWNDNNVRFELGEPYENGSDERIQQVYSRVHQIFNDTFSDSDTLYVVIKDFLLDSDDIMFGNTTPDYLYGLLDKSTLTYGEMTLVEIAEDEDESGNSIELKREYKQRIYKEIKTSIPYFDVLKGIANYEQGREPSISQSVYFVCIEKGILFYMYDDRGCVIFSTNKESIRHLYNKFNDWIVDYWRKYFVGLFEEA